MSSDYIRMATHVAVPGGVMITDLDHSDKELQQPQKQPRPSTATQPKRQRKVLQTLTGNFSRRSRSVEVEQRQLPPSTTGGKKKPATQPAQSQERTLNGLVSASLLLLLLLLLSWYNSFLGCTPFLVLLLSWCYSFPVVTSSLM